MKKEITKKELSKIVLGVCYDRQLCKSFRVKYNNIKGRDLKKIERYYKLFHYTIKDDS